MKKTITILNESGIHARPASMLVKTASKFTSEITFESKGSSYNVKSIMNVLSMGLKKGEEVIVVTEGTDENEAMAAIVEAVESKFGEA